MWIDYRKKRKQCEQPSICQTYALDKSLLGQKSAWTTVPWTKVPWTTVSLDNRPLDNCCNTKLVFHQKSSSFKGCRPSKVVFHQKLSSIRGHPPLKVVFHQRSSSIKDCLPSKDIFHQRLSSIKSRLPSNVVFHQNLSSIRDYIPFCCINAPELLTSLKSSLESNCHRQAEKDTYRGTKPLRNSSLLPSSVPIG